MANILLIDDEAPLRQNLARYLRMEGHEVREACDGIQGLEMAQAQVPALIFCDVMMPRMNGMQVLAAIQTIEVLRGIPFIFISASAEPELLKEALSLGASAYLIKPFRFDQLHQVLQAHLPDSTQTKASS